MTHTQVNDPGMGGSIRKRPAAYPAAAPTVTDIARFTFSISPFYSTLRATGRGIATLKLWRQKWPPAICPNPFWMPWWGCRI